MIKIGTILRHRFIVGSTPVTVTRTFNRPDFVEVDFGDGERDIVRLCDYVPA